MLNKIFAVFEGIVAICMTLVLLGVLICVGDGFSTLMSMLPHEYSFNFLDKTYTLTNTTN